MDRRRSASSPSTSSCTSATTSRSSPTTAACPPAPRFACGLTLRDIVPQGHKVALVDIAEGAPVRRYDVAIGYALKAIPAGSWVHERLLQHAGARARSTACRSPPSKPAPHAAARGLHLRGLPQRRRLGRHAQHPRHHADRAVRRRRRSTSRSQRIKAELLPNYPERRRRGRRSSTPTAAASRSTRPTRSIPIRTLRNISLNPNFGGEVMVVSLGCEKLQPERLLPPGTIPIVDERNVADVGAAPSQLDVVCLQDDAHVGFMSMIDSIMRQAEEHLERLNARRRETVPGQRTGGRRAVRRQRRVLRRHRQSGGRLLHRPAGARRRDRDVLGSHRSARRHRPADLARRRRPKWPRR